MTDITERDVRAAAARARDAAAELATLARAAKDAALLAMADALDAAHAAGVVHRDVKPQNILVDTDDRAFLADFGLTRVAGDRSATMSGRYTGSLDYAAPEQFTGAPIDARTDVYAAGTVLYRTLTDAIPFPAESDAAKMFAHLERDRRRSARPIQAAPRARPGGAAGDGQGARGPLPVRGRRRTRNLVLTGSPA